MVTAFDTILSAFVSVCWLHENFILYLRFIYYLYYLVVIVVVGVVKYVDNFFSC